MTRLDRQIEPSSCLCLDGAQQYNAVSGQVKMLGMSLRYMYPLMMVLWLIYIKVPSVLIDT